MKTGEVIKEQRLKKGLTQEDLAAKTDVSARTIQRIENSEVEARAFTLQSIATALEVDYETLNKTPNLNPTDGHKIHWLPLLHFSGLFNLLIPPLLIWLIKRKNIKEIDNHGISVLNFQLSIIVYTLAVFTPAITIPSVTYVHIRPLLVILSIFSIITVLTNALKVLNGQQFKYPLSIKVLKCNL